VVARARDEHEALRHMEVQRELIDERGRQVTFRGYSGVLSCPGSSTAIPRGSIAQAQAAFNVPGSVPIMVLGFGRVTHLT
jgi:hypothetical protein